MDIYRMLRQQAAELAGRAGLLELPVEVRARVLTPREAIGDPGRTDFPLQKGKERLVEAQFQGASGQAFTDQPGHFTGTLGEVFELALGDNYSRANWVGAVGPGDLSRLEGSLRETFGQVDAVTTLQRGGVPGRLVA